MRGFSGVVAADDGARARMDLTVATVAPKLRVEGSRNEMKAMIDGRAQSVFVWWFTFTTRTPGSGLAT